MIKHKFKKQFGQNFLSSPTHINKLLDGAELTPEDTVVEIGPGAGAVTLKLLERVKKVIALEIDTDLIPVLEEQFGYIENFELINIDALEFDLQEYLKGQKYKLVSSLPYNVSKPLIRKFLTAKHSPQIISVILQKEVAKDYVARPPKSSFLANFASVYAESKYLGKIPARYFHPKPKVDGGILQLKTKDSINLGKEEALTKFIKQGFSKPRKVLSSNLAFKDISKEQVISALEDLDLPKTARAAELSTEQWMALYNKLT